MKKFYPIFVVLCAVALFTACSDDDGEKDNTGRIAKELSKTYQADDLTMTMNGAAITGSSVAFSTENLTAGKATFKNLLPGEEEIVADVTMTETTAGSEVYNITGNSSNANREVTVKGTVGGGMKIDVTSKVLHKIANTWKPSSQVIQLAITPGTLETIDFCGIMTLGPTPIENFQGFFGMVASSQLNNMVDLTLELKDNSHLIANWKPVEGVTNFEPGHSQEGVVKYNVVDKQVFVALSPEIFTNLIPGTNRADINIGQLLPLIQAITKGLPLNVKDGTGEALTVSVNKEMMLPYLDPIAAILKPMLADLVIEGEMAEFYNITGENLSNFLDEIIKVIKDAEEFEIIINLDKA